MKFTLHGNFFPTESTTFSIIGPDDQERDISYTNNGYTTFLYPDNTSCPDTGEYYVKVYNNDDNTYMHFINPLYIVKNDDFHYSPRYFSDMSATGYISVYKNSIDSPELKLVNPDIIIYPEHITSQNNNHIYKLDIVNSPPGVYTLYCNNIEDNNNLYIYEGGKQTPVIVFNPRATIEQCESFVMYFNGFHLDMLSVIWFERESDGLIYHPEIIYMFSRVIRLKCDNLLPGTYTMIASYEDNSIHQGITITHNFIEVGE